MLAFTERHFNQLLLAAMGLCAWSVTVYLMTRTGTASENVAWSRDVAAGIVGALLLACRPATSGELKKDDAPGTTTELTKTVTVAPVEAKEAPVPK